MKIMSSVISVIFVSIIFYLCKIVSTKKMRLEKNNGQRDMVIKGMLLFDVAKYIAFIFGIVILGISITYMKSDFADAILGVWTGLLFIMVGFFFIKANNENRVEYDEHEIKQYRVFRKEPIIIKWGQIENVTYKNIGPLLEIKDNKNKIFVDFRLYGVMPFIKFAVGKVESSDAKILKEILIKYGG